ncbi:MAG: SGNH/GDSL hydrolase family protein [Clostridiales bacterium]|nr:SGNH/GDSL hydrolase family protein [Clostridiales bacterium]
MEKYPVTKETSNASLPENYEVPDIEFHNIKEKPFSIHGLLWDDELGFVRLPKKIGETDEVLDLIQMNSGGRVIFSTDSQYVAIKVLYNDKCWFADHMTSVGACGFDLYEKVRSGRVDYQGSFMPIFKNTDGYCTTVNLHSKKQRNLIINFPMFAGVRDMYVGVIKGSTLDVGSKYKIEKPVVFYGSSITHGACASRPGISYPSMLSMKYDFEFLNMGFSGRCKGQKDTVEYLASLDMSVFVLDYDHNAPNEEHLKNTHYYVYETIRKAHPDIPIVMASRPTYDNKEFNGVKRREIINKSYLKAKENGDKNVYFVDGKVKFKDFYKSGYTVDGVHPTDVGFEVMTNAFIEQFEKFIRKIK